MRSRDAQLPRVFEANIFRLVDAVGRTGLVLPPIHSDLARGQALAAGEYLNGPGEPVDDHTASGAAKAFASTLSAVFGRQLRAWARAITVSKGGLNLKKSSYSELLHFCAEYGKLDLIGQGLRSDLIELELVANVVRHGDGPSCDDLSRLAPRLWAHASSTMSPSQQSRSELMRIGQSDLQRYIRATTRFWAHLDSLPFTATAIP
jgi:hypothetical protein